MTEENSTSSNVFMSQEQQAQIQAQAEIQAQMQAQMQEQLAQQSIQVLPGTTPNIKLDPSIFIGKQVFELSKTNFISWQIYMKSILKCYGLQEWVDTDKTPKIYNRNEMEIDGNEYYKSPYECNMYYKKTVTLQDVLTDNQVQMLIRSTLGPRTSIDIQNPSLTSYQIWKTLESIYLGDESTIKEELINEINRMKYDPKVSISRYIVNLNNKFETLERLNVMISDEEKMFVLYRSLPPDFQYVTIFQYKNDWRNCMDYVSKTVQDVQTVEHKGRINKTLINQVFSSESGYGNRKFNKNSNNKTNNYNNNYNKHKNNYKNHQYSPKKQEDKEKKLKCFFCNQYGHKEKDCKLKKEVQNKLLKMLNNKNERKKGNQVYYASTGNNIGIDMNEANESNNIELDYSDLFNIDYYSNFEENNTPNISECSCVTVENSKRQIWTLDSGSSNHLTNNEYILRNKFVHEEPINYANGEISKSKYVGNVVGNIKNKPIELKNVMYIPDIKKNLISIAKLVKSGYTILFKSENDEAVAFINDNDGKLIVKAYSNENDIFEININNKNDTYLSLNYYSGIEEKNQNELMLLL